MKEIRIVFIVFLMINSVWAQQKPNIVLILVDDLGWSDTAFMGNPIYETPHLDKLAAEGVVFDNAYAPAANCAPSRACILSGRNTPTHGVYTVGTSERGDLKSRKLVPISNTEILDDHFFTVAEALKKHGYTNASVGKWHVGNNPTTQGFDVNIGGSLAGHPVSYFSPYKNKQLKDGEKGEYLTDRLTTEAIDFMSKNKEEPFFLYLPYYTVHTPLQGKNELVKKYEKKINKDSRFNAQYGAMIESMDENVGRLLNALKTLKIEENTLVVFFSDNGGVASVSSQLPLRAGKGSYYEGGIRVPCVFKWPGKFIEPKRAKIPITGLDFFPTLMEILGDKNDYKLEGLSLLPFLAKNEPIKERALFWHFPIYLEAINPLKEEARDSLFRTRPGSVIQKGKWKLHEYFEDQALELYDLEGDIGERVNLINKYPDKANQLYQELKIWREKTNALVPQELNKFYQRN